MEYVRLLAIADPSERSFTGDIKTSIWTKIASNNVAKVGCRVSSKRLNLSAQMLTSTITHVSTLKLA